MTDDRKQHFLEQTLTVAQLRDALEGLDDDAPVFMTANYGDLGRTQQALPIGDAISLDAAALEESGYSHTGFAVVDDPEAFDPPEGDWDDIEIVILG